MQALVVYLIVAIGVQQHQIVVRVRAAEVSGLDVVSIPAGGFGDRLTAVGAFSRLLFVKVREQTSSGKFFGYFSTDATLKVQFIAVHEVESNPAVLCNPSDGDAHRMLSDCTLHRENIVGRFLLSMVCDYLLYFLNFYV
jgi:hypothetical protein